MDMIEKGGLVWVPAIADDVYGDGVYVKFFAQDSSVTRYEASQLHSRADGQEPEPASDVARLREACEMALRILAYSPEMGWGSEKVTKTVAALRAALAATEPSKIESVQVGDAVTVALQVRDALPDGSFYLEGPCCFGGWLHPKYFAVVSRPAPAVTCETCRWFRCNSIISVCTISEGHPVHRDNKACSHYEPWPPKAGA
jgi:hypothetical protein